MMSEVTYFISTLTDGSMVKIGTTKELVDRFRAIQAHSPQRLKIYAVIKGGRELEQRLHTKFAQYRQHNEWFIFSDEIRSYIDNVPDAERVKVPDVGSVKISTTKTVERKFCLGTESGAITRRVWLACSSARRMWWLDSHGQLELRSFIGPFRRMIELASESKSTNLGIITFKPVADALRRAWNLEAVPDTADRLAELFKLWHQRGIKLEINHFGMIRQHVRELDYETLIVLGDPDCVVQLVAHSSVVIVIGSVRPSGWADDNTQIVKLDRGRPHKKISSAMQEVIASSKMEGASRREIARRTGISESTLRAMEAAILK